MWSLKLIYGRTFGETANIVMYDREISLLARFSKMTGHVRIFSYCKGLVEELFLGGAKRQGRVSWSCGKSPDLGSNAQTTGPSQNGGQETGGRSTVASPAGQTRLVPVVRNWFNMWNGHVAEVLQRFDIVWNACVFAST